MNTKMQHLQYPDIYAAGDCCRVVVNDYNNKYGNNGNNNSGNSDTSDIQSDSGEIRESGVVVGHWFQMKLWSQVGEHI